jgi:hypothetical protein
MISMTVILLSLCALFASINAFKMMPVLKRNVVLQADNINKDKIEAEKAKMTLVIAGPSIGNALFRAELKKELTFFRGMSFHFI